MIYWHKIPQNRPSNPPVETLQSCFTDGRDGTFSSDGFRYEEQKTALKMLSLGHVDVSSPMRTLAAWQIWPPAIRGVGDFPCKLP